MVACSRSSGVNGRGLPRTACMALVPMVRRAGTAVRRRIVALIVGRQNIARQNIACQSIDHVVAMSMAHDWLLVQCYRTQA